MAEYTFTRIVVAWIVGFVAHAVVMQASSRYGSPRGYFLIGAGANALSFFLTLVVFWPLFSGGA